MRTNSEFAIRQHSVSRTLRSSTPTIAWHSVLALLMVGMILAVMAAPEERTMGDAQRVVYIHVAVAWLGLLGFLVTAGTSVAYLMRRELKWDEWSQAAAETGWLCCSLTLITGSLWAHAAWGTWWTWEPRLVASFILWSLYSGCLLLRSNIHDPHQRARLGSLVAIFGALDVPFVVMATRWFRGMHPVTPEMEPSMRLVLLLSVISFTALFATITAHRRRQIGFEHLVGQ